MDVGARDLQARDNDGIIQIIHAAIGSYRQDIEKVVTNYHPS